MNLPERRAANPARQAAGDLEPPSIGAGPTGSAGVWSLRGAWTVRGMGRQAPALPRAAQAVVLDGSQLDALDSAGAWTLRDWLGPGAPPPDLQGWPPRERALMLQVQAGTPAAPALPPPRSLLQHVGRLTLAAAAQAADFVAFIGELAIAALGLLRHPRRFHVRMFLREVEIGGFDALPIIGLTAFLLGVVVAYQGVDQLKNYGANVFVVELVGYAMLREFAPLISAIIVAGRSGSAHAAQIGTMVVNEEIDAMRTLGIDPLQRLVLPKMVALVIALPLLTVFADVCGVFGGMVMARTQLDIGFGEFLRRFGTVMEGSALLVGVGKTFVFAFIIVAVGCFQGLRTRSDADSVGRQTTLSVVQASFLVIVMDALFSIAFNLLGL